MNVVLLRRKESIIDEWVGYLFGSSDSDRNSRFHYLSKTLCSLPPLWSVFGTRPWALWRNSCGPALWWSARDLGAHRAQIRVYPFFLSAKDLHRTSSRVSPILRSHDQSTTRCTGCTWVGYQRTGERAGSAFARDAHFGSHPPSPFA